ncbi:hypothetical protein WME75_01975 [Sorangium sp. So ce1014]|uniref:hypothetical protein n=1 Tax=Sorangium sp. So ce1014 TaxID=3133326 RepID=UPI003F606377
MIRKMFAMLLVSTIPLAAGCFVDADDDKDGDDCITTCSTERDDCVSACDDDGDCISACEEDHDCDSLCI